MKSIRLVFSDTSIEKKELIICDNAVTRTVGMLKARTAHDNLAFYIKPCNSIHTFFMAYKIDVLFIDASGIVLKERSIKPYRFSACKKAFGVIEGSKLKKNNLSIEKVLFY